MRFIRIFSYSIVILVMALALALPFVFQFVGVYSTATSVYAIEAIKNGHLSSSFLPDTHTYWGTAISDEVAYPFATVLISQFLLVTGFPQWYIIFVPIVGLSNIVYFVLARRILCDKKTNDYGLLFSALFYAFATFTTLHTFYVGRATLGAILLSFFYFTYLMYMWCYIKGGNSRPWLILSILFTIASGLTYYTAIFSILLMTLFMGSLISLVLSRRIFQGSILSVLSIFLIVYNYFFQNHAIFDLGSIMRNFVDYVTAALGFGTADNHAWLLLYGFRNTDVILQNTHRFVLFLDFCAIVAVIIAFVFFVPKINKLGLSSKKVDVPLIWIFCSLVIFQSLSILGYLSSGALAAFQPLIKYGLIVFFFSVVFFMGCSPEKIFFAEKGIRFKILSCYALFLKKVGAKRKCCSKILVISLVGIVGVSCFSLFMESRLYGSGSAKLFGYNQVNSAAQYICTYSSSATPVTVTSDMYYAGIIFFQASIGGQTKYVLAEPLRFDAITLYYASINGNPYNFFANMSTRNIHYLLTVDTSEYLWGEGWGWTVPIKNFDVIGSQSGRVYDGKLQLFYFN